MLDAEDEDFALEEARFAALAEADGPDEAEAAEALACGFDAGVAGLRLDAAEAREAGRRSDAFAVADEADDAAGFFGVGLG